MRGYDVASWPRKIYWRRLKKEGVSLILKFPARISFTPEEAFLASGRPVFDVPMPGDGVRIAMDAQTHPYMCGDIKELSTQRLVWSVSSFIEIRRVGDNDPTPLRVVGCRPVT